MIRQLLWRISKSCLALSGKKYKRKDDRGKPVTKTKGPFRSRYEIRHVGENIYDIIDRRTNARAVVRGRTWGNLKRESADEVLSVFRAAEYWLRDRAREAEERGETVQDILE